MKVEKEKFIDLSISGYLEEITCVLDLTLYNNETFEMMARRWGKLEKDFKPRQTERQAENGIFDISKIPDIYDCIKYDTLHNSHLPLPNKNELYAASKALADVIVPQVIIACISFKTKKEWEYFPILYF